jgi:phosphoglycerate-specific signal transduction histidine kinase
MGNEITTSDLLQLQRNLTDNFDRGRAADTAQMNRRFDKFEQRLDSLQDKFDNDTKSLRKEMRLSGSVLGSMTGRQKMQVFAAVSAGAGTVFAALAKAVPYLWNAFMVRHP